MLLSPGVALGHRYELEERVGAGGFSDVWRARDLTLDRTVAVKVLHAAYVQDAEALARFRAEARHAGSLAHENIARVYDYGEPHPPYLVMELVDGPSFAQVLTSGPMDPVRAMDVVAQAAAGLQAAHEAGLVHRDIKPGNLLITPDGIVKITDFGISHAVGSAGVTSTGLVVGTPGYLAPERAAGGGATALSDLYSLGVVAYECLAGAPPFDGTALEVALAHVIRPLPALPSFVPADVRALVAHLTAKDPADRPGSAAEVARQARQLGERLVSTSSLVANQSVGLPGPAGEPQPADRSAAPVAHFRRPRRSAVIGGAAAALIALVVLVGVKIGDPEPEGSSGGCALLERRPSGTERYAAEDPDRRNDRCQHRLAARPARRHCGEPPPPAGADPADTLATEQTAAARPGDRYLANWPAGGRQQNHRRRRASGFGHRRAVAPAGQHAGRQRQRRSARARARGTATAMATATATATD